MNSPIVFYLALFALVLINAFVTRRLFKTKEPHKILFFFAIWLFPIIGPLMVLSSTLPAPVSPHPIGGEQNPPGSGSL